MPECANIHSRASAMALKIFGADLSPNCSTVSTNSLPCHLFPSNGQSLGCTGAVRYVSLMSNFDSSVLAQISASALSTDMNHSEKPHHSRCGPVDSFLGWLQIHSLIPKVHLLKTSGLEFPLLRILLEILVNESACWTAESMVPLAGVVVHDV